MIRVGLLIAAFTCALALQAHPEIEASLARINAEIAAAPLNAGLYVDRGELYARHEDWVAAEANYLCAAELAPENARLARARGALELSRGRPRAARAFLDTALARDSRDVEALVLRGRANRALNDHPAAIADFDSALARIATPPPELFLERAALLSPADAVRSLDAALERLGPVVALELRAASLEESLGRIEAAVARFGRIAEQSERKESWFKRCGDLLLRAGRTREAQAAYAAALAEIAALPDWLRESPEMTRLVMELTPLATSRS